MPPALTLIGLECKSLACIFCIGKCDRTYLVGPLKPMPPKTFPASGWGAGCDEPACTCWWPTVSGVKYSKRSPKPVGDWSWETPWFVKSGWGTGAP